MQWDGPIPAAEGQEEITLPRRPVASEYRHEKTTRRREFGPLGRASILWLAACSVLGLLRLWCGFDADRGPAVHITQVAAANATAEYRTRNIEDLRRGDMVVAWDPVTGQLGRHEIADSFRKTADHLRVLEFLAADGATQTISTTDEHPFWSVGAGDYVAAGDLRIGDRFISPAGEFSTLIATYRDEHPDGVPVYNFEVSGVDNYYIRAHGLRGPPLSGHNATSGLCPVGGGAPKTFAERVSDAESLISRHAIDMTNAPVKSARNAHGFRRNGPWFWRQLRNQKPEMFSPANLRRIKQGRSPVVDETWLKAQPATCGISRLQVNPPSHRSRANGL